MSMTDQQSGHQKNGSVAGLAAFASAAEAERRTQDLAVPGLGTVRIQALTAREWTEVQDAAADRPGESKGAQQRRFNSILISRSVIDENGSTYLPRTGELILALPAAAMVMIQEACIALNDSDSLADIEKN